MGYLSLLALLVLTAFHAYEEGKYINTQHVFENIYRKETRAEFLFVCLFLGFVSVYYGIGLPKNGMDVLAIFLSFLSTFTISFFLSKSDTLAPTNRETKDK